MQFILFYTPAESLNHFIDELAFQLSEMKYRVHIEDVSALNAERMFEYCSSGSTVAICYDGFCALDRELCDRLGIILVNLFMDHPMSFVDSMTNPPERYIQLMPDENHVTFAKRFYGIEHAYFCPHMASMNVEFDCGLEPYEKEFDVFFPAGYRSPNSIYQDINERFNGTQTNLLALNILEYLLENTSETIEAATQKCASDLKMEMDDALTASFLSHAKLLDHFVRMYHREKTVVNIVAAGIPIALTGESWRRLGSADRANVTILPNLKFTEVFSFMEHAKITLNVMPWFKRGTHDRIFNALLHNSCPLTDTSGWLVEHMLSDEECFYYSLDKMEELPEKIEQILKNPDKQKELIEAGRKKVLSNYTSRQITEKILEMVKV
jgi:glycosyltransferase involved in cell wall biosynthesis